MDLAEGGRVEVPVALARAEGFEDALEFRAVQFPPGLRLEAGPEEDGQAIVALIGDPGLLEPRAHRIALRATATGGESDKTEVTRGFTLQVK